MNHPDFRPYESALDACQEHEVCWPDVFGYNYIPLSVFEKWGKMRALAQVPIQPTKPPPFMSISLFQF